MKQSVLEESKRLCKRCGKHRRVGKGGLCKLCKRAVRKSKDPQYAENVRRKRHEYYIRAGGPAASRAQRNKVYFDGKRDMIIERDGNRCCHCGVPAGDPGTREELVVHHLDERGYGVKERHLKNNDNDNLVLLCRACHAAEHARMNRLKKGVENAVNYVINHVIKGAKRAARGGDASGNQRPSVRSSQAAEDRAEATDQQTDLSGASSRWGITN